jgi:hypothetical protein
MMADAMELFVFRPASLCNTLLCCQAHSGVSDTMLLVHQFHQFVLSLFADLCWLSKRLSG